MKWRCCKKKMNILRAWHFKSCFFTTTISHLLNLMPFFALCATSHWSLFTASFLLASHGISFPIAPSLSYISRHRLPPSVNNCDINLKGLFLYDSLSSMRWNDIAWEESDEKYREKNCCLWSWTPWLDFNVNGAIAGSFWRDNWNDLSFSHISLFLILRTLK